ncbi:MAG: hypothetical protein JWM68_45 [Verrucomicrobiales bacterium]|nr:hypothetical protein [Verrucomicrobiales bacterium]
MHLPKGITGFYRSGSTPPPQVSLREFKSAGASAARMVRGRVLPCTQKFTQKFHDVLISLPEAKKEVRVLCNAHYPVVAFALPAATPDALDIEFCDCPELAPHFDGYTVLSQREATAPVQEADLSGLDECELDQVRYWEPQCVGNVIFNYWD